MTKPALMALLLLAACTPMPKSEPILSAAAPSAPAAKVVDVNAGAAMAERDLKALDYNTGKDSADPAFARAIVAFERDQGLAEDGQITSALLDRLGSLRALLAKAPEKRPALYVYSDGATRSDSLGFLLPAPKGLSSDAPANFLIPLKPGNEGTYRLGTRAKASFTPSMTITCHVGRLTSADTVLGAREIMPVDCAGRDSPKAPSWRAVFSPELNAVTRLESGGKIIDLVALRPATAGWPAAARTGLEWALTHQLDSAANAPAAQWSSTGVPAHFEIRAAVPITGQQAGLSGKFAALSCRRFEMTASGARFPGLACREKTSWFLPGAGAPLAAPANTLTGGKLVMGEKGR